jgi:predicted Zn-dependent peptidase
VSGGQAAAATATALHASLQARLPAPCRIEVELTTTHVRYVVHVPPASTTEAGAGLLDVLTSSPVVGPQGTLPQPRWLHEADIGPWLAAAPSSKAVDVVAFHGRHYRLEAMGLVLGAHPTPGRVGEALAEHLARRTKLPAEVASPAPNGHATPDGTASGPVPLHEASRWACLAVEGPPPDAWAEAAALAVAGEVLASRLSGPLNRRVNVTLEAAPGKTWLVLASQAPGERFATTLEGQLAALRDDTVDLAELEQARTRVRAALGDPAHDKGTRLRGVGRDMVLGRPGATAQALAAVAQVGRTEVQAAAQRFCCGPGLRIRVPEP